jgi:autotransporter strand-loop-strand O-heptosyltransferase
MVVTNKYDDYIHCDVKDTRENQTGHNYRVWIDKWCDDILTFDTYFYDLDDGGKMIYHTILNQGMWAKVPKTYFGNYRIEVTENGEPVWEYTTDWNNKKVFIRLETGAMGDLLAFIPQIEKFREKWNLDLRVFHGGASGNGLNFIKDAYPKIKFTQDRNPGNVHKHISLACSSLRAWMPKGKKPIPHDDHLFEGLEDTIVPNIYGKHIWQQIPLQQVASDGLGLDYVPLRPKIKPHPTYAGQNNFPDEKYVVIASQSTAQIKYWNYGWNQDVVDDERHFGDGWREVIDWLIDEKDYKVVVVNKYNIFGNDSEEYGVYNEHKFFRDGCVVKPNASLIDRIIDIKNCHFFMGLNSGMSWIAYALEVPIVAIMALNKREEIFGVDDPKIKTLHVHDYHKDACGDCFKRYTFNRYWTWCPEHKGTDRMYECTSLITPDMVKEKCEELIEELS